MELTRTPVLDIFAYYERRYLYMDETATRAVLRKQPQVNRG